MEKLSRVKKFEDLRKQMEMETDDEIESSQLSTFANRLNDIDPRQFKKMNITNEEHVPARERREDYFKEHLETPVSSFKNEYLEDFIKEVKDYNIKKGTRENENTQIDILNQLHQVTRARREHYVQDLQERKDKFPLKEEASPEKKEEIARQVQNLLNETVVEKEETAPVSNEYDYVDETHKLQFYQDKIDEKIEEKLELERARNEKDDQLHKKLVEETQQLRIRLNEYESELTNLNDGIDKTHRMLNFILGALILSLLIIIGVGIAWVLKSGGIF